MAHALLAHWPCDPCLIITQPLCRHCGTQNKYGWLASSFLQSRCFHPSALSSNPLCFRADAVQADMLLYAIAFCPDMLHPALANALTGPMCSIQEVWQVPQVAKASTRDDSVIHLHSPSIPAVSYSVLTCRLVSARHSFSCSQQHCPDGPKAVLLKCVVCCSPNQMIG